MEYLSKIIIVIFIFVAFDMIPSQSSNSAKSFEDVDTMIIQNHKTLSKTKQVCQEADAKKEQMINEVTQNITILKIEQTKYKNQLSRLELKPNTNPTDSCK